MESTIIFILDSPQYHLLTQNEFNHFKGFVFDYNGKMVTGIDIYGDNKFIGRFATNIISEDVYQHVPHILNTRNCRFDFDLYIDSKVSIYTFKVMYYDNCMGYIINYDIGEIQGNQEWFVDLNTRIKKVSTPSSELVFKTQGIYDPVAYQNSIIPGVYNMKKYLINAGIALENIHSILDIGCGTGRLLFGWYLDKSERHLVGCDINKSLLNWASTNLPDSIKFYQNTLLPPLPFEKEKIDFTYLVSVFTHLSIDTQKIWVGELHRIIAPGGVILITLHGEIYINLFHSMKINDFQQKGYLEIVNNNKDDNNYEGSNYYGTYHNTLFTTQLFDGFDMIGYYPKGEINGNILFPIAALQDVYVFKKKL